MGAKEMQHHNDDPDHESEGKEEKCNYLEQTNIQITLSQCIMVVDLHSLLINLFVVIAKPKEERVNCPRYKK